MPIPESRSSPLVSVIVPTYNAAPFVHQAVQSVVDQTYGQHEIIVVDDGSSDETRQALSKFQDRLTYIYQQNRGAAAARNTGVKAAKGGFICFLDADDLWPSDKLELQLDFFEQHRDMGLLSGRCRKFMDQGDPYTPFTAATPGNNAARIFSAPNAFTELVRSNFIPTSTVMIRKECFDKVGFFDLDLIPVEDRDMWLRIAAHFGIAHLPWMLCKKRLHRSNISNDKARMLYTRVKVLEKNRVLFPGLAPSNLWNGQLANLYTKAGRLSLITGQKEEARQAAVHSLKNALTAKAAMLWIATFMGRRALRIFLHRRIQTTKLENPSGGLRKVPRERPSHRFFHQMMTQDQRNKSESYKISIIVATYNRANSLARFLSGIDSLEGLDSTALEVLIVDNDSTDRTRELLIDEQRKPRNFLLRVFTEEQRGQSSAINRGLSACQGEIICLLDDDVVVDRLWIGGILHSYGSSDFDAFQGRVLPGVDPLGNPADAKRLYCYNIPIIDRGERIKEVNAFVGAHMTFRRKVFEKVGFFDVRLGPGASGFGGDTKFSSRVRAAGFKIGYSPHMTVYHELDPNRYGGKYNRGVRYRMGLSESLYLHESLAWNVFPNLLKYSARWVFYRVSFQRRRAYKAEGRLMKSWGYLIGHLQQRR